MGVFAARADWGLTPGECGSNLYWLNLERVEFPCNEKLLAGANFVVRYRVIRDGFRPCEDRI